MNNLHHILEYILDAIEYELREEIDVDLIADKFGLSVRHLQRLFKLEFNQSLGLYIRSRKLAASIDDLLKCADLNVLDIALNYGFEYEQSYIRSFRREFGITPGTLRKTGKILPITPPLNLFNSQKYPGAIIMFGPETVIILKWHVNDVAEMISKYYKLPHKNVTAQTTMSLTRKFPDKLEEVVPSGQEIPDVVALESDFVRKYVESGQLLDLTDIYEASKDKFFAYPVEIGTYNNRVYALPLQACPGAMFYRRSLAKKYLGTDDPKAVQDYFSTINKFLETSILLKKKSGGSCVVVSSSSELYIPFMGARLSPWVVDRKLVIDPMIDVYLNLCKTLNDYGIEAEIEKWGDDWLAGMRGEARNWEGKPVKIFSYFLPTWGIPFVLKPNAAKTKGDWALIPGPVSYSWGGTWFGIYRGTNNPGAAKELVRYLTTDDVYLERYAKETGDFVSNTAVVNKIKENFEEPFLGGQNHYAEFAEMAKNVNYKLIQKTDSAIQEIFYKEAMPYSRGEKSKEQALDNFRMQVNIQLGL